LGSQKLISNHSHHLLMFYLGFVCSAHKMTKCREGCICLYDISPNLLNKFWWYLVLVSTLKAVRQI